MSLGNNVQRLRRRKDWTPMELAVKAGVSVTTIINLEKGGAVNSTTIIKISDALGVKAAALMKGV